MVMKLKILNQMNLLENESDQVGGGSKPLDSQLTCLHSKRLDHSATQWDPRETLYIPISILA